MGTLAPSQLLLWKWGYTSGYLRRMSRGLHETLHTNSINRPSTRQRVNMAHVILYCYYDRNDVQTLTWVWISVKFCFQKHLVTMKANHGDHSLDREFDNLPDNQKGSVESQRFLCHVSNPESSWSTARLQHQSVKCTPSQTQVCWVQYNCSYSCVLLFH